MIVFKFCILTVAYSSVFAWSGGKSHEHGPVALDEVQNTVDKVFQHYDLKASNDPLDKNVILGLKSTERESIGVANRIRTRILALDRNGDCRRCWFQKKHCICDQCIAAEDKLKLRILQNMNIRRIYLMIHHKEIGLAVDTCKYIASAYPITCRIVVNGIDELFQSSMKEMVESIRTRPNKCLVLFPEDDSKTFEQIYHSNVDMNGRIDGKSAANENTGWDVIVIDGTWSQARKMNSRITKTIQRVCLSDEAVQILAGTLNDSDFEKDEESVGHQLRRHPIAWRQVSTLEAVRLFIRDMAHMSEFSTSTDDSSSPWNVLKRYQIMGDMSAKIQLGPPRAKYSQ